MLRRGMEWQVQQAEVGWGGTDRKSHNQNMKQKQKVTGREGKEKILLKNGNNVSFSLFMAGFY